MYIKIIVYWRWKNEGEKAYLCFGRMNTTMEKLWEYTQEPHIHTEWDARFTEISYVEKQEGEPQKFLYKTKIGFGLEIAGEGESIDKKRNGRTYFFFKILDR